MSGEFTRYQLRQRLNALGIAVRYGQFATYIEKGLLPDPQTEPWVEAEIMPRMLRIHELDDSDWSLDRRVVVLYTERYPVPVAKLREAMAEMLPSIHEQPVRKLNRIVAAGSWLSSRSPGESPYGSAPTLSASWKLPARGDWAEVLRSADLQVFAHRLTLVPYATSLLATLGRGTPHDLSDMNPVDRLTLTMVVEMAVWHGHQQQGKEGA